MNYFYCDKYGVIHGTKHEDEAKKAASGEIVQSDVPCGVVNDAGETLVEGYPIYFTEGNGKQIPHEVYIYTDEKKIFIGGNKNDGIQYLFSDVPSEIQEIVTRLGY